MGLCSQQKEEEPKRSLAGLKLDAGMEDLSVGNIYVWGQWSSCTRSCGSGKWIRHIFLSRPQITLNDLIFRYSMAFPYV